MTPVFLLIIAIGATPVAGPYTMAIPPMPFNDKEDCTRAARVAAMLIGDHASKIACIDVADGKRFAEMEQGG